MLEQTNEEAFESVEDFLDACKQHTGADWADHASQMIDWWSDKGGKIRSTRTTMMLDREFDSDGEDLALLTLSTKGTGEIGTLKLRRHGLLDHVLPELSKMGFRGNVKLSYGADDLASGIAEDAKSAVLKMDAAVSKAD